MRKEDISNFLKWFLKTVLMFFGFIITIIPFIPLFREYLLDAHPKPFGTKEIMVICLGGLIFTGGIYSNKIIEATKNRLSKILNS